mgnify:CR=1 FL=1
MRVPVSWLREFAPVPEDPAAVGARLASVGFAVDGIEGVHWDKLEVWSRIVGSYPNIRLYVARI